MLTVLIGGKFDGKAIAVQDDLKLVRMPIWESPASTPRITYYEWREWRKHGVTRDVFHEASMTDEQVSEAFLDAFYGPGY